MHCVGVIAYSEGGRNPKVPNWLASDFRSAVEDLAEFGAREVVIAEDSVLIQSALGVIALAKGLVNVGKLLLLYDDDEIGDMVPK